MRPCPPVPSSLLLLALLPACPSPAPPSGSGTESESGPPTTSADTTEGGERCGNGLLEEGEECDGTELDGLGCTDLGPAFEGGTLACGPSCTLDATACTLAPDTPLVVINEITSEAVLAGDFAGPNDAIELVNTGTAAADLSGWRLSDDPSLPLAKTYVLPEGTTLEPGAFLVLLTLDETTMTGVLPFGVSDSNEETIALADDSGAIVSSVLVDGYLARVSWCRVPDGLGPWLQCEQTFGAQNQTAATACGNGILEGGEACDGQELAGASCAVFGLGYTGGTPACSPTCELDPAPCTTDSTLVINELSATTDDIELYNGGDAPFELSGLVLTDDDVDATYDVTGDMEALVFAPGTTLGPGEYLVIPQGLGPNQHPFGLGASGDAVVLLDPSPVTVIDQVAYGEGEAEISYCRQPNGPGGAWMACGPSMGGAN